MLLLLIAFCFAGLIFVSEPLIQMSLFRFSVYPKLLSCIAVSGLLLQSTPARVLRITLLIAPLLLIAAIPLCLTGILGPIAHTFTSANLIPITATTLLLAGILVAIQQPRLAVDRRSMFASRAQTFLPLLTLLIAVSLQIPTCRIPGLNLSVQDHTDSDYLALCHWSRDHTPIDAIFLVPPAEQHMRYQGQRAIVVNFKGVPQLGSELGEWRDRLQAIIDMPLDRLPHRFDLIHAALSRRYDELSVMHLAAIAHRYQARYLVLSKSRSDPATPANARIVFENPRYQLYDLTP